MFSSVLNSEKAIEINIIMMRTFVLARQYALSQRDLTDQLKKLERKYNKKFKDVYEALIRQLAEEKGKLIVDQKNRQRIGFNANKEVK